MKILECSSKGDKRFSSLYAKVKVFGKYDSIENHYQLCKRFGDYIPKTWGDCKGRRPAHIHLNGIDMDIKYLTPFYKLLWCKYLDKHPSLVEYAKQFDDFHDMFKGNSINCQADVIRQYVKKGRASIIEECKELICILKEGQNNNENQGG